MLDKNRMKIGLLPVLLVVSGLCLAGNTYYVDPVLGDDAASGDAAHPRQTLVGVMALVTPDNGDIVYAAPGFYTNKTVEVDGVSYRVSIPAGTTLLSMGTRENTFIVGAPDPEVGGTYGVAPYGCGQNAVRCGYLAANAKIDGFTITGGRDVTETQSTTPNPGGLLGVKDGGCLASDCIFSNNVTKCRGAALKNVTSVGCYFANNRAGEGNGDAFQMQNAYNCVFGPTARYHGYYMCEFYNCTFLYKTARTQCKVYNSLILEKDNHHAGQPNSYYNCFYTELDAEAVTNGTCRQIAKVDVPYDPVTYVPLPGSAAIDAGDNSYVKPSLDAPYDDYLGNPRVYNGTVDVGAVEARAFVVVADLTGLDLTGLVGGVTQIPPGGLHVTIARNYKTALKVKGIRINGGDLFEFEGETSDRVWEGDFADGEDVSIEVVYVDANDWYVDAVHGDDANDGYTPYRARKTLKAAMALPHLKAGEIVHAAAGMYDEGEVYRNKGDNNLWGSNRVVVAAGVGLVATNVAVTFIKGRPHSETENLGTNSVRCVFLEEGAWVENFTITNGFARGKWGSDGYGGGICSVGGAAVGCRIVGCGAVGEGKLVYGGTLIRCFCGASLPGANKAVVAADAAVSSVFSGASVHGVPVFLNSTSTGNVGTYTTAYNSYIYYDMNNLTLTNCRMYYGLNEGSSADEKSVVNIKKLPNFDDDYRPARTDTLYCDTGSRELYDAMFPAAWVRFKDKDYAGGQRVYNAKIDIGAGEADWREVYTTALAANRTTVVVAGPGVTAGERSLNLEDGDTLVLRLEPKTSGEGSVTVVSEGDVTVTCDGQVAVRTDDVYTFRAEQGLADVTISVTGGSAVVSNVRLPGLGLLLLFR